MQLLVVFLVQMLVVFGAIAGSFLVQYLICFLVQFLIAFLVQFLLGFLVQSKVSKLKQCSGVTAVDIVVCWWSVPRWTVGL